MRRDEGRTEKRQIPRYSSAAVGWGHGERRDREEGGLSRHLVNRGEEGTCSDRGRTSAGRTAVGERAVCSVGWGRRRENAAARIGEGAEFAESLGEGPEGLGGEGPLELAGSLRGPC